MKRIICLGMPFLVLLFLPACTSVSTTPHIYTFSGSGEFEVLGEIIYESRDRTGYTELLRAARRLYPECDFVIDIMIDRVVTTTSFPLLDFITGLVPLPFFEFKPVSRVSWIMRGTAIMYK